MRLAVAQIAPKALLNNDLARLSDLCIEAKQQGAELLLTPEMALNDYELKKQDLGRNALFINTSETLHKVQQLAMQHQIALVVGFAEQDDQGRFYNSTIFISANGELLQHYRKVHLYGDLDRSRFEQGNQLLKPVFYGGLYISLAICYDIEFPELARFHRQHGCDLLLVPTANMHPFHQVATHMIPVRAMENAMAIAYSNFVGMGDQLDYCGYSSICAANGKRLALADDRQEVLLIANINASDIEQIREELTYLNDRRLDLYPSFEHKTNTNDDKKSSLYGADYV